MTYWRCYRPCDTFLSQIIRDRHSTWVSTAREIPHEGRIYIRVRLADGTHPFLDPVKAGNNKLKPLYALVNGVQEHHPEGSYYLRYMRGGKRVWELVGVDPAAAVTAAKKRELYGCDVSLNGDLLAKHNRCGQPSDHSHAHHSDGQQLGTGLAAEVCGQIRSTGTGVVALAAVESAGPGGAVDRAPDCAGRTGGFGRADRMWRP